MRSGIDQSQRLPTALRPDYVLPDELTLAQRIRATLAFANRLTFVDRHGRASGHWGQALERDETVILAELAVYPIEREQAEFLAALPLEPVTRLMARLWAPVTRMDAWYQLLRPLDTPDGAAVSRLLGSYLQGNLGELLRACLARHAYALPADPGRPALAGLNPIWNLGPATRPGAAAGDTADRDLLRETMTSLAQAIGGLKALAKTRLPFSLTSGRHDPSVGLLLAFLHLQQKAQLPMNLFPERLKDFYYGEVLGLRPRAAALEQAHLLLEAEPTFEGEVRIEQGQRFLGGRTGAGAALEFEADHALQLVQARVASLYAVQVERDPLVAPEHDLGFATRVLAQPVAVQPPEAAEAPAPAWCPLFGGSPAQDARLGFAVTTPLFELGEGERELRVTLHLLHPADRDAALGDLLKPGAVKDPPEPWLTAVFERYAVLDLLDHPTHPWPSPGPGAAEAAPDSARTLAREALARSGVLEGDLRLRFLVAQALAAGEPRRLAKRLGLLFSVWLVESTAELLPEDHRALRAHACAVLGRTAPAALAVDDPLTLIYGAPPFERPILFERVFRGLWKGKVSTPKGWLVLDDVFPSLLPPPYPGRGNRIELRMQVGPELGPICPCVPALHGPQWPAHAALILELQTQARVFGYSLASRLVWRELELGVTVRKLRDLLLCNQVGRLDAGKPFQPFGPLPALGNHLVLGSEELASKPLRALQVRLRWGDLPRLEGGFPEHYAGYPEPWDGDAFQVRVGILKDGQWRDGQGAPRPLFAHLPGQRRIHPGLTLALDPADLRRFYRPSPRTGLPFDFSQRSRNGFFRFELSGPADAFGHALYPNLLTAALTRNTRKKRFQRQEPLPRTPYTPVVQWLEVDYEAGHTLHQGQTPNGAEVRGEPEGPHRVFHLHPFGQEEIFPNAHGGRRTLLPHLVHDGNLYLGLEAREALSLVSLFFHLRPEAAGLLGAAVRPALTWACWCEAGWRDLAPGQVLADGTLGMLRSGIVRLELPAGMTRTCPQLPGACFWLRLSADWGLAAFAGLYGVHCNAIRVTRVLPPPPEEPARPLPAGTIQASLVQVPGLKRIQQVGATFGLRAADAPEQVRVRGSERLRHKGRASTSWDYARLLLDRFPELFKVKVFPHQGGGGQVRVVVVPYPQVGAGPDVTRRVDAAALARMAGYLRQVAAPGLDLEVRNADYEAIQVRCELRLARASDPGRQLRLLNQALVDYLSPWHPVGYRADFDWEVRSEDLETCLRAQPGVEAIGPLTLLHVMTGEPGRHRLEDSARQDPGATPWTTRVRPASPWSLALPTPTHLLELVEDVTRTDAPATGIDRLAIGTTFIISGAQHG